VETDLLEPFIGGVVALVRHLGGSGGPDRGTRACDDRPERILAPDGVTVAGSFELAMSATADEGEVIGFGGGEIYAQLLDHADRLEITEIAADLNGDVYFPKINPIDWNETERVERAGYSWVTYRRARRHRAMPQVRAWPR
jgi:dihydrofolate reductase